MKNESLWEEIEEHPLIKNALNQDDAWKWLQKLQELKLSGRAIICLKGLLDAIKAQEVD